jgi:2'-5' RNA ligase/GNAT superfamily N-acetyltransferase
VRRRLGVALLLDPPCSEEVNGLRRALGDSSLEAVAPHVTLVPPINVRAGDLDEALAVVRRAANDHDGPLRLEFGPVATFVPVSPVVYLSVAGPDLDHLARLRSAVMSGPFLRPDRWPFVPHVTLADQATAEEAEAAVGALGHFRSQATIDRVVVLQERQRRWHPLADTKLAPSVVVGRGGLELEITEGRVLGPDVLGLVERQLDQPDLENAEGPRWADRLTETIVLTGRRERSVAGAAVAWLSGRAGEPVNVSVLVDPGCRRQGVGRALLARLEVSVGRRGWAVGGVHGHGPAGFFDAASGWVRTVSSASEAIGQHLESPEPQG